MKKIVERLFKDEKVKKLTKPFRFHAHPERDEELRKDFEQEIYLQLLNYKDEDKLRRLYRKKQLDYFILGIIKNQYRQRHSSFNLTHRRYESYRRDFDTAVRMKKEGLTYRESYD